MNNDDSPDTLIFARHFSSARTKRQMGSLVRAAAVAVTAARDRIRTDQPRTTACTSRPRIRLLFSFAGEDSKPVIDSTTASAAAVQPFGWPVDVNQIKEGGLASVRRVRWCLVPANVEQESPSAYKTVGRSGFVCRGWRS